MNYFIRACELNCIELDVLLDLTALTSSTVQTSTGLSDKLTPFRLPPFPVLFSTSLNNRSPSHSKLSLQKFRRNIF